MLPLVLALILSEGCSSTKLSECTRFLQVANEYGILPFAKDVDRNVDVDTMRILFNFTALEPITVTFLLTGIEQGRESQLSISYMNMLTLKFIPFCG